MIVYGPIKIISLDNSEVTSKAALPCGIAESELLNRVAYTFYNSVVKLGDGFHVEGVNIAAKSGR